MRFSPVSTSKESYQNEWKIDQGFGAVTTYGRHEGVDLNLKTGGDTDLGQPLYAIAPGQIVYYHYGSHPTSGFGRHIVYRIEGPWGVRWVMYSHCDTDGFLNSVQNVTEGQVIARLGKSGNSPTAHLHLSIWKVDPSTNGGIDSIAHNDSELNAKWEDPLLFIEKWSQPVQPPITDQTIISAALLNWPQDLEVQQVRGILNDYKIKVSSLENKISAAKVALG